MELAGKRVMVVGLGRTGAAVARFAAARGAALVLADRRADVDRSGLPAGAFHLGPDDPAWLDRVDLVVTSPGVARDAPLLSAAVARGIPVIGEIELASRFITAPIAAITGTNGKSTVTVLLGEILKAAGMRTFVGGNLGTPLIDAAGGAFDAVVAEVSSFQLEWIEQFRPHVGVHLNLSDDHFERYRDLDDYGRAKARLFENQDESDWAILNRDDPKVWKLARSARARVMSFTLGSDGASPSIRISGKSMLFDTGERSGRIGIERFRLPGRHNLHNAMAAAAAALALEVETAAIECALGDFTGLPHRVEFVREARGVTYIDDSKGTNVGAVVEALETVEPPIILIVGGLDKGGDYAPLADPVRRRVRCAILNGAARRKIAAALNGTTQIESVATLSEAVKRAARIARRGDTVLLSPACSSFDQFSDYAQRGDVYKKLVRAL